jgi:hypothetical protein
MTVTSSPPAPAKLGKQPALSPGPLGPREDSSDPVPVRRPAGVGREGARDCRPELVGAVRTACEQTAAEAPQVRLAYSGFPGVREALIASRARCHRLADAALRAPLQGEVAARPSQTPPPTSLHQLNDRAAGQAEVQQQNRLIVRHIEGGTPNRLARLLCVPLARRGR